MNYQDKRWGTQATSNTPPNMNTQQSSQTTGFQGSFNASNTPQSNKPNKRRKRKPLNKKKLIGTLVATTILLSGAYWGYYTYIDTGLPKEPAYEQTARYVYDQLPILASEDTKGYAALVEDPWVTKNIAYFNGNEQRLKYYQFILKHVAVQAETETQVTRQGQEVEVTETLDSLQKVKVQIPDYATIAYRVEHTDAKVLASAYKARAYTKDDYNYEDTLIGFFIEYMQAQEELPTKVVTLELPNTQVADLKERAKAGEPLYTVGTDAALDDALFASTDFHTLLTTFAAVVNGDIGKEQDNPALKVYQKHKEGYEKALAVHVALEEKAKAQDAAQTQESQETQGTQESQQTQGTQESQETQETQQGTEQPLENTDSIQQVDQAQVLENNVDPDILKAMSTLEDNSTLVDKSNMAQVLTVTEPIKEADKKVQKRWLKEKQTRAKVAQQTLVFEDDTFTFKSVEPESEPESEVQDEEGTTQSTQEQPAEQSTDNTQEGTQASDPQGVTQEPIKDNPDELTPMEKVIGLEPTKKTFIRKQVDNPSWLAWQKFTKEQKAQVIEPLKKLNEPLEEQVNIPYTWIGAHYLQKEYTDTTGKQVVIKPQRGNGTFSKPASLGTVVQGKAKDKQGNFHDVKVSLKRILTEQDAIKYAIDFDNRNRGFDNTVDSKLVVIEFELENLENKENTLVSGFALADSDGNEYPRNGRMYSFRDEYTFKPGEKVIMQDWFYGPSLDNKYIMWGKGFNKQYPLLWFDVLAFQQKEKE